MDEVQKHNSFNTNTPSSESYRSYFVLYGLHFFPTVYNKEHFEILSIGHVNFGV
jgi:hypothetical protein